MTTLVCSFVLVMISSLFHRQAKAIRTVELNRAFLAYNSGYDLCREITDYTRHESKTAADNECEKAFKALDLLRLNACSGWRHAACRLIPGQQQYQCTCLISLCDSYSIRSSIVTPFRNCAPNLRAQEENTGQAPAPTANFQQTRREFDEAWEAAEVQRYFDFSSYYGGAGGLEDKDTTGGVGWPSGAGSSVMPTILGKRTYRQPWHLCDQCGHYLRSARGLFDHKRKHHTVVDSHCYVCNRTYKHPVALLAHLRLRHPEIAKEEVASRKVPDDPAEADALLPYCCRFCNNRYSSAQSVRDHEKSHTTFDTICPCCTKTYSTKASLKLHMIRRHPGVPIPEQAAVSGGQKLKDPRTGGPFWCDVCGKQYGSKKGLRDHKQIHDSLDCLCIFCNITLSNKANHKIHMERRHPEWANAQLDKKVAQEEKKKPEKCPECGKRFKNVKGLRNHQAYHEGRTTCEECNAVLSSKSIYWAHKRNHHPK